MDNRVVVLGSHKGLGYQCVKALLAHKQIDSVLGLSRQDSGDFSLNPKYKFGSFDFTKVYDDVASFDSLISALEEFKPTALIYCAGGGPHGSYFDKAWKDHAWALKLNFLFPAKLIWHFAKPPYLKVFAYVGSAIAESEDGDPDGASYAAAKWGMKGLIKSLKASNSMVRFTVFSPGYMDTELVPQGAKPRQAGGQLQDPSLVAQEIVQQLGL
jgi:NAD(P)-dependent dehydrogenase (short-subunit alcohol dehydrogenase family)